MSLPWAHMSACWFCHAAAHLSICFCLEESFFVPEVFVDFMKKVSCYTPTQFCVRPEDPVFVDHNV